VDVGLHERAAVLWTNERSIFVRVN